MVRKTNLEKVHSYLKKKKISVTKSKICMATHLKRVSVDNACRVLRKRGLIGWCYRKYWGVR